MNHESIRIFDTTPSQGVCLANELKDSNKQKDKKNMRSYFKAYLRGIYIKAATLGIAKSVVKFPDNPKAVVVATGNNLGGTIISLPLIEAVRRRWPNTQLVVVTNAESGADIVRSMGLADHCYVLSNPLVRKFFFDKQFRTFKRTLRQLKPEILIDNHDVSLGRLMTLFRIPIRIGHTGYSVSGWRLVWDGLYNVKVPSVVGQNWLASYASLANTFHAQWPGYPKIEISAPLREEAQIFFQNLGISADQKMIAIQAGVWKQQNFKQWPLRLLAQTCADLWREKKWVPVIMGIHGQEETLSLIESVMPPDAKIINLLGLSPSRTAALLTACAATITNDSGLMHLSAAVGTPTVALYGMTDPAITWCYDVTGQHRIIRRKDIKPCYVLEQHVVDNCHDRPCLNSIYSDIVTQTVLDLVCG